MKSRQTSADKAYEKGVKAGQSAGFVERMIQGNKDAIPMPSSKDEKTYDKGFVYGVQHRGKKS